MMNQGVTDAITTLDPNSLERHAVDPIHGQAPSYYAPSTVSQSVSWTTQDGSTVPSAGITSSSGAASVAYSNYPAYPNSDPYGYGSTGYAGYYNSYQQQPNQSYPQQQPNQSYPQQQPNQTYAQPAGAYQSTGAPHQPISSFQNTGSYAGPVNYSTTYYNPGDYQTSGGYSSANYSNQTNSWNQGSHASYGHQYPNYTAESNGTYSSQNAQYQQDYKQWTDYYSQTEVTCAPGTENVSATSASNQACPLPGVSGGYSALSSQQPPSTVPPAWRPEPGLSELPPVQV